ncbi:MAG TPA: 4-(cytidine 5'-diphospho)-2-C-methyl-D-erythritol kinase [Rhizomicrobium sp.]|nr:4-(cytidine 5'-diphospho)-2-C-methyl-D-erythritol kinase [Rhizomicrobium sp.]
MNAPGRVVVSAPAKVNLCLHVGGRRPDGYHNLESLVAFVSAGDEIRLEHDRAFSLSVSGPFGAELPVGEDNLVFRAARLLAGKTVTGKGARIHLEKNLPLASGLGGGSADAAAVLRGLVQLWNLDVGQDVLRGIASSLGADIPVCLASTPAWMEGKGEIITLLPPLPGPWLLLVNPRVPVPTAAVFAGLRQRRGQGTRCPSAPFADTSALVHFLRTTTNDLEAPARAIAPVIDDVLDEIGRLPDVLLVRMSGSGATCFGMFESECVDRAMRFLIAKRPDWWIQAATLASAVTGAPRIS